jgi:hypothetical protein
LCITNYFVHLSYGSVTNIQIKMTNEELKKLLDNGDYVKIARMAGYTNLTDGRRYVYKVLSGRITGTKGKAKDIIDAAHIIAARNAGNGKSYDHK